MANPKAKCCTNHFQEKKYTTGACLQKSCRLKPRVTTHEFRVSADPLLPPELPDRWKFGFVVSESTVSYIPSIVQSHATFSLVSYLDRDFLGQLFVSPEVSIVKKKNKIKKSRIIKSQLQGFTSIATIRRICYALYNL